MDRRVGYHRRAIATVGRDRTALRLFRDERTYPQTRLREGSPFARPSNTTLQPSSGTITDWEARATPCTDDVTRKTDALTRDSVAPLAAECGR
jgi:hypothetical protein